MDKMRQHWRQKLEDMLAGRDIVSWCLRNPEDIKPSPLLRKAVLGQHPFVFDTLKMIQRLTEEDLGSPEDLISTASHPDRGNYLENIHMWKLAYCDVAIVTDEQDLARMYLARLRDEELQTPEERARELIRTDDQKTARRNAKWMIPIVEKLTPEELRHAKFFPSREITLPIWQRVSPPPPRWIQTIVDDQNPWGFVYYKTAEVQREYGDKWKETWRFVEENITAESFHERRDVSYTDLDSIHCGGHLFTLAKLETREWLEDEVIENSDDDEGSRAHFRQYRNSLESPGILRNTFIVVEKQPIADLIRSCQAFLYVWAYDADWHPPPESPTERSELEAEQARLGYRGRVKVPWVSLSAWFYAARSENVNMYDMWLKAQKEPDQLWLGYTKPLEQWDHEPFV